MTRTTDISGNSSGSIILYEDSYVTMEFSTTTAAQALIDGYFERFIGELEHHRLGQRLGFRGEFDLKSNTITGTGTYGNVIFGEITESVDLDAPLSSADIGMSDFGVGVGTGTVMNNGLYTGAYRNGFLVETHISVKDGFVATAEIGVRTGTIKVTYHIDRALNDYFYGDVTETEALRSEQKGVDDWNAMILYNFVPILNAPPGAYDFEVELETYFDMILRDPIYPINGVVSSGETRTILTPAGPRFVPIMETVDTPSGEQQVWVGSSYLIGGTSGNNNATSSTTTGQSSGGPRSGPGNGYLSGNSNSNSSNDDDDDDDDDDRGDNIFGESSNGAAAGGGTGAAGGPIPGGGSINQGASGPAGGPIPQSQNVGTPYVNTGNNPGNNNAPGYNPPRVVVDHTATEGRRPILLDLDGNGIQLTDLARSTVFMEGDEGLEHRTAWAGAGDGVLFYDTETVGQAGFNEISDIREYVFTEWDPTAKDDLSALRSRFDTNGDGMLTGTELNNFKVMVTGANGVLNAQSVASLGITQINLTQDATHIELPDGSVIAGQGTYVMGGLTRTLANTTLMATKV